MQSLTEERRRPCSIRCWSNCATVSLAGFAPCFLFKICDTACVVFLLSPALTFSLQVNELQLKVALTVASLPQASLLLRHSLLGISGSRLFRSGGVGYCLLSITLGRYICVYSLPLDSINELAMNTMIMLPPSMRAVHGPIEYSQQLYSRLVQNIYSQCLTKLHSFDNSCN